MRRARPLRLPVLFGLVVAAGATGCTHNHYYTNAVPVCVAPADMTTVHYGEVCEVPSGTVVAQTPGATTVLGRSRSSRVLVSQPHGGGSRLAWRRPDPEGLATTRVEGGIDEDVLR